MRSRLAGCGCESGDFCRRVLSDESWIFEQVGGANGDEPVSPVAIATSVAAHPRRSPRTFGEMKALKRFILGIAIIAGLYVLLPLAIFDFTDVARPYDEEDYAGRDVALGPKPRWWVPKAAWKLDIPGGFSYDVSGWPFVVWKPLCIMFVESKGYALPSEWRK